MNWLVMLHRLLDDPTYTPTDELHSFGLAAREGMYNTALIDREMDDQLGQKPILAFGNSSGDYPMFDFVTHSGPATEETLGSSKNRYPSLAFCLLCDDTVRELGNTAKADKCRQTCEANGWVPVSMANDWDTIYGPDVKPTTPTAVRPAGSAALVPSQPSYTLDGRRLIGQPSHAGVYIYNGVKRVIK